MTKDRKRMKESLTIFSLDNNNSMRPVLIREIVKR